MKKKESFRKNLAKANTEEEVKHAYADCFSLDYDTEFRHDLYSPEVFYEFKFERNLAKKDAKATVLAQVMYYIRRLRFEHADKVVPPVICVAEKKSAFLTETTKWKKFYGNEKYDWDLAPSQPDHKLVEALGESKEILKIKVFEMFDDTELELFNQLLTQYRSVQLALDFREKKIITEDNFEEVFDYWNKCFGDAVRNGTKPSRYFLCDIQEGGSQYERDENKVVFHLSTTEKRAKKILPKEYEWFWDNYEKVADQHTIRNILAKIDRLTDEPVRRFTGEFYTPVAFARKAHAYLERVVGKNWWTKKIRLWDMAAGSGNLEWFLPFDAYKSIYLSSLHEEDVLYCKRLFPEATVFQYDYLNDDIDAVFGQNSLFSTGTPNLPSRLLEDLEDPEITWLIFINPPFATAQKAGYSGQSKKTVSETAIRPLMHAAGLGEVSRELFAQFLFRIKKEFQEKKAYLGLFSTLKYVNANNDQNFRDKVFQFTFLDGFVFSSANFQGTKAANPFPVGFLIWDLAKTRHLEKQKIEVSILDDDTSKIGKKRLVAEHRSKFLNKWIDRAPGVRVFPPFGSAISVKGENTDVRDRVADGFLASLMCNGNDVQHHNNVAFLSGPYVSAGALSVTAENFGQAMIVHAVRKNVKKSWINDRDQFLQPAKMPSNAFIRKCTVWSLFSESNQTVSMRNIRYKGQVYQIVNHFFPFKAKEVKGWKISDSAIKASFAGDIDDRFVSSWLHSHSLSAAESKLMEAAKDVYRAFYEQFKELPTSKYKIEHWDAGWWQIKRCLVESERLGEKLTEMEDIRKKIGKEILDEALELGIVTSA